MLALKFLKRKEKPQERILVLVDYENVAREASVEGKIVDFKELAGLCRSLGSVIASFIFMPDGLIHESWTRAAYDHGFFVVSSPSRYKSDGMKMKDTADTNMIALGRRFFESIDQLVIVSNDSDFLTLVNEARDRKKKVVLISGEKVSPILRKVVDINYPIPLQDRRTR
jgi:hypothetical protein